MEHVFDGIGNLYELRIWKARVFTQYGARISQACDKHTNMLCHSYIDQHNCNSVTLDLIGKTPQATVEMIQGEHINTSIKLHSLSQVVITCTDAGWTLGQTKHHKRDNCFFIAIAGPLHGKRIKHVSLMLALESSATCGNIVNCSRNSNNSR